MNWRKSLGRLLGTSSKSDVRPKAAQKSKGGVVSSARAAILAEARRIHRAQSANVRATLSKAIDELQRGGAKTLRDPEALGRLMALIHVQQTMLRLAGIREGLDRAAAPKPAKSKVVRR